MIITKIEVQKKNKQRVNLYLDGTFFCGLSAETIVKNKIKEGQKVSLDFIEILKTQTEKEVALNKATSFISKSQKSKKQVYDYLIKKGFEQDAINFAIQKLEEYHYVDDELFANNYIKYKTKNNGKYKVLMELKQKGIDENLAKERIENLANDSKNIFDVAKKYLKNKNLLDLKTKQKAYRFLASKGYDSTDIINALNTLIKEDNQIESWY